MWKENFKVFRRLSYMLSLIPIKWTWLDFSSTDERYQGVSFHHRKSFFFFFFTSTNFTYHLENSSPCVEYINKTFKRYIRENNIRNQIRVL